MAEELPAEMFLTRSSIRKPYVASVSTAFSEEESGEASYSLSVLPSRPKSPSVRSVHNDNLLLTGTNDRYRVLIDEFEMQVKELKLENARLLRRSAASPHKPDELARLRAELEENRRLLLRARAEKDQVAVLLQTTTKEIGSKLQAMQENHLRELTVLQEQLFEAKNIATKAEAAQALSIEQLSKARAEAQNAVALSNELGAQKRQLEHELQTVNAQKKEAVTELEYFKKALKRKTEQLKDFEVKVEQERKETEEKSTAATAELQARLFKAEQELQTFRSHQATTTSVFRAHKVNSVISTMSFPSKSTLCPLSPIRSLPAQTRPAMIFGETEERRRLKEENRALIRDLNCEVSRNKETCATINELVVHSDAIKKLM